MPVCFPPLLQRKSAKISAGFGGISSVAPLRRKILESKSYQGIAKTRYVNDKQITDHYAIIPTGQGLGALKKRFSHGRKGL